MAKLTDQTAKTTKAALNDLIHVVDVSDTSDDPAGSSFKQTILNALKGATLVPILGALVWKAGSGESTAQFEDGDWVIYMSGTTSSDRLVIGIATGTITNISGIDSADFTKFFESNPLLP
jgi:hypothetical protein